MIRPALVACASLLALAACSPVAPPPSSAPDGSLGTLFVPLELRADDGFRPGHLVLERGAERAVVLAITTAPASDHAFVLENAQGEQVAFVGLTHNDEPERRQLKELPLRALDLFTELADGLPAGAYALVDLASGERMTLVLR